MRCGMLAWLLAVVVTGLALQFMAAWLTRGDRGRRRGVIASLQRGPSPHRSSSWDSADDVAAVQRAIFRHQNPDGVSCGDARLRYLHLRQGASGIGQTLLELSNALCHAISTQRILVVEGTSAYVNLQRCPSGCASLVLPSAARVWAGGRASPRSNSPG